MNKLRVLVLGGADFHVSCFNDLNIAYSLIQTPEALTPYQKQAADKYYLIDYTNINELLLFVRNLPDVLSFDAVFSFTEFGLLPAAVISAEFGIKSNCQYETVNLCSDKLAMRDAISQSQCPHLHPIHFANIDNLFQLQEFFQKVSCAIILKPKCGVGSQGVVLVESEAKLPAAFLYANAFSSEGIIAEKYIGGLEYSVETLSKDGVHEIVAITEKITSAPPNFVEIGHNQPVKLDEKILDQISCCVVALLDLVQRVTGPSHTEIKVDNGKVYIIETQPRTGGDNIWNLTQITTGTDLYQQTIAHILGFKAPFKKSTNPAACVRFFKPGPGKLVQIRGKKSASAIAGVLKLAINVEPGDIIQPMNCSTNRVGYVVVAGHDLKKVTSTADQVLDTVEFIVS